MITWGITAQVHDAAISVLKDGEILFAAHSERYSKIKQDHNLNQDIINEALYYGKPDVIAYYENPWTKKLRQIKTGYFNYAFNLKAFPKNYISNFGIKQNIKYVSHHTSHASAGFYTSPFKECAIVVIDSLGEFSTITIWSADSNKMNLIKSINFPSSLGLLYSAFTKRCNLKPNEEEYILMGMAAYGNPIYKDQIKKDWLDEKKLFALKKDCHKGIENYLPFAKKEDLASSIQKVLEECVEKIIQFAKKEINSNNIVYMGGVALNCVANNLLFKYFENVWIMPNPGDAGSSLGCAAFLEKKHINWKGPYLGKKIEGEYPIEESLKLLQNNQIFGIANGRAEFGPRALGNRSLFADPRSSEMKDKVNEIKKRQKYRPFAPIIPLELSKDFFDLPTKNCDYMQFVGKCKYPKEFPAIVHFDGTSRVQTLKKENHPQLHTLLMEYYSKTGCPMLLNTSLNIRGMPIVNDERDAKNFEELYNVKVL